MIFIPTAIQPSYDYQQDYLQLGNPMLADSRQRSSLLHRDFQSFMRDGYWESKEPSQAPFILTSHSSPLCLSTDGAGENHHLLLFDRQASDPSVLVHNVRKKKGIVCNIVPHFKQECPVIINSKHRPHAPLMPEEAGGALLQWARAATGITAHSPQSFSSSDTSSAPCLLCSSHSMGDTSILRGQPYHRQGAIHMYIRLQAVSPNRHDMIWGEIPVQFRDCHLKR